MKRSELQELIQHITSAVIKEYTSLSSSSSSSQNNIQDPAQIDPNAPPVDVMTSAEKARAERDKEHDRQQKIKQGTVELDAKKKEMDFNKKKLDQQRRFDIPNMTKDIQTLKGAKL